MAEMKKYLDVTALGTLVDQIKAEDAKTLKNAKDYADGLAKNYDAAGSAATAESNAKAYTDELANGQVKTNKEAIATLNGDANTTGSVAKAVADAKTLIDADVDAVEAKADKNAEDIAAINNATTGILAQAKGYTDTEVAKVQGEVDALETYVGVIPEGSTSTNVIAYVQEKTAGIATEGAMTELGNRVTTVEGKVATIEGDYLKAADKTELEGKITNVQTAVDTEKSRAEGVESGLNTRLATVEGDYLKAADKTELSDAISGEVTRATGVEAGLAARIKTVEDDYLKAADKEALQTQINTIMNNPDVEGAINSINEFTAYVAEHGTLAEGFRSDIDKNKEDIAANTKAIEDHALLAGQTYATKAELASEKKALQDEIDADVKVVADDLAELEGVVTGLGTTKADVTYVDGKVEELQGADTTLGNRITALEGAIGESGSVAEDIATAKQEAIDAAAAAADTKDEAVLAAAKKYADDEDAKIESRVAELETASATHALASDLTALDGRVTTAEGKVSTLETEMDAVETKASANETAIGTINTELAKKAAQADLEAAVARVATNEGKISTLETTVADKAEQDDLDAAVERIAKNEGDIATLTSAVNSWTPITSAEVESMFA